MTLPRAPLKTFRTGGLIAVAAALTLILPAGAQVAPPSRQNNGGGDHPRYVGGQDFDREPYYVDGVQYKPYVPEKKAKTAKPADADAKTAATRTTTAAQPAQGNYDPGELRPFSPAQSTAQASSASKSSASAASARSAARAAEQASASSSAAAYVPKKRARYGAAIIQAVDKVTAENVRFEAPIGQPVRYKGLIYTIRACETTSDDEPAPDVIAYMQVRTNPEGASQAVLTKSKEIFSGWTFASAPSLNPMKHPVYDAWVIACRRPLG